MKRTAPATELGDPIEVAALTRAFRETEQERSGQALLDRQYCAIGSVKTNIGHLDGRRPSPG